MSNDSHASPPLLFRDGAVQTSVDLRSYRLTAVQKAAYRLAGRCTVVLGTQAADSLSLTFLFSPRTSEETALEAVRAFFQELLDQELREQIGEETHGLRQLILAQAFSRTDLLQR